VAEAEKSVYRMIVSYVIDNILSELEGPSAKLFKRTMELLDMDTLNIQPKVIQDLYLAIPPEQLITIDLYVSEVAKWEYESDIEDRHRLSLAIAEFVPVATELGRDRPQVMYRLVEKINELTPSEYPLVFFPKLTGLTEMFYCIRTSSQLALLLNYICRLTAVYGMPWAACRVGTSGHKNTFHARPAPEYKWCEACQISLVKKGFSRHVRNARHLSNVRLMEAKQGCTQN